MNSLIKVDVTQAVIGLDANAEQGIAELLDVAKVIQSVRDTEELAFAVHAMKQLREHPIYGLKAIKAAHKTVKAPVLELGKRIDELAKECEAKIQPELDRVNGLANAFTIREYARIQELERQRQAEIAAAQKAQDEALAAVRAAEAKVLKEDAGLSELETAQEAIDKARAAMAKTDDLIRAKTITVDKPVGLIVKQVVRFEVIDAPALYAVRPEFFDLVEKRRVISDNITLETKLPGLRIWQETTTETR